MPDSRDRTQDPVESFRTTSGRVLGVIGLLGATAVVVIGVVDREHGFPLPVVLAAVFFGVLAWASMLRPRVWATADDLVMRNMLHTARIPLAAIDQVAVRQVLAVSAGEQRYVSPAIGKTWRQTLRSGRAKAEPAATQSYPVYVEERISQLAEDARAQRGVRRFSAEQAELAGDVRRSWAWPEIGGLALAAVAFVAVLLI